MEYTRILNPFTYLKKKSFFLFGPRSTGKTWLIKKLLPPKGGIYINLLSSDTFLRLAKEPGLVQDMAEGHDFVIIDEIQRLPILLNEVQDIIESKGTKFLLTGSSARRLKRENANLLGGRAGELHLYPLTTREIPKFNLEKYLMRGGIPRIYSSNEPEMELEAYVATYLEQEIKIEANVRRLEPFGRFLKSAALCNGELLNFSNVASDSEVPSSTVREYYSILEDTLMGFFLEPWLESKKRKAIQTPKFYFFDPGVCHFILGVKALERNSNLWGKAFEQFLAMEIKAYLSYHQRRKKLYFWRNISKHEVDFIIDDEIAIEVKSTKKVLGRHLLGLKALKEEGIVKKLLLVSEDKMERTSEGIRILHWRTFLDELWDGKLA